MMPPLEPMTLLSTVFDAELLSCALTVAANATRSKKITPTQYLVALCEQCVAFIMAKSTCFEPLYSNSESSPRSAPGQCFFALEA